MRKKGQRSYKILFLSALNSYKIVNIRKEYLIMLLATGTDIGQLFANLTKRVQEWGGYFIAFIGLVLIIVGIFNVAKAFMQHGKAQVNWVLCLCMILVGGFLFAGGQGGFQELQQWAGVGNESLKDLTLPAP